MRSQVLVLVTPGVALRITGVEIHEHHLRDPGIPLDAESLGMVDGHQRLRATGITGIPDGGMDGDARTEQAGTGSGQGHYEERQVDDYFVECDQVLAGLEMQPAVVAECQLDGFGQRPISVGYPDAAGSGASRETGHGSQRNVQTIGLKLRFQIPTMFYQRRITYNEASYGGAAENTDAAQGFHGRIIQKGNARRTDPLGIAAG